MCIVIDAIPAAVATTTVALTIVTATGTTIFETISAMVREGDLHMCREGRCGIPLIGFGNRVSNNKRRQSPDLLPCRHLPVLIYTPSMQKVSSCCLGRESPVSVHSLLG